MILIKNFTEAEGKDFGLTLTQKADAMTLAIELPNHAVVDVLSSSVSGVYNSMKKSLEHVGKKTHNLERVDLNDGKAIVTQMLDKYPTEVIFYVKDKKIALRKPNGEPFIPVSIDVITPEEEDKRFPRDIIAMIVPKRTEDGVKLEYDPRNLVGKPIIVTAEDYQIVLAMIKWPVWANLKFPVYLSVTDSEGTIGSIQLASKTENGVARNQIIDADNEEATKYLEESKKIMEERAAENRKNRSKGNNNNKFGNQRQKASNRGVNTKGYNGSGKNYNRNGQR